MNVHGYRPSDVLHVVSLKLARANEHLVALDAGINSFLEGHPNGFIGQFENQRTHYVYRIVIHRQIDATLLVTLGEALYQLRSIMDHLALAMNAKGHGRLVSIMQDQSQFPVCKTEAHFQDRRHQGRIKWMTPGARSAVQRLQPFDGRHKPGHELWVLDKLFNIDKHRHLTVTGSALDWWARPVTRPDIQWVFTNVRPMKDGAEIGRWIYPSPQTEVHMDPEFAFGVAFQKTGPARGAPVVPELRRLHRFIKDTAIPALSPFV